MHRIVLTLLLSIAPCAHGQDRADAELEFSMAQKRGLLVDQPLRWDYQIVGVSSARLRPLIAALTRAGFTFIEVPEQDAENDAGEYEVWVAEERVHTIDSYAARLERVSELAEQHLARVEYWTVNERSQP